MAEETVSIVASLKDQFTGPLTRIARGLRNLIKLAKRVGRALTAPFRAFGRGLTRMLRGLTRLRTLVVLGIGVQVVRTFAKFEAGLAQVSTLVDTAVVDMERLKEGVIAVGLETGDSFESLNRALFDIISAGIDAADAVEVLAVASKLAAGGATSTAEATSGLVSLLNAYGLEAKDATEVSDALFQAMKGGITTIGELSSSLGKVSPVAKAAGVSLDEMVAAVAALTKGGISTQESVTALRAILSGLIKPTVGATKQAEALGIEFSTAAIKSKGFVGFLQEIAEKTELNEETLGRLFPNLRALVGILALGQDDAKSFAEIFATMADKAGATDEAAKKVFKTLESNFKRTIRTAETFFIRLGDAAKPFLIDVLGGIRSFFSGLSRRSGQIKAIFNLVVTFFKDLASLIAGVFDQGDIAQLAVNVVVAGVQAAIQTVIALLPTAIRVLEVFAKQLATALIRTFVGQTSLELGKAIQGTSPGAVAARLAAKAAGIDTDALDKQISQIRGLEDAIKRLRNLVPGETIGLADDLGIGRFFDVDNVEAGIALFEERLKIRMGEAGVAVTSEAVEKAIEELKFEAGRLPQKAGVIIDGILETLGSGLSPKVTALGEALTKNLAEGLSKIEVAAKTDVQAAWAQLIIDGGRSALQELATLAVKVKSKTLEVLGLGGAGEGEGESTGTEGFGAGAFGTASEELDKLNVGFQTFFNNFDTFEALGASLGSALANGISGLVDVLFTADATFKQFASNFLLLIGKMIIQMTILRALAAFFFAVGGTSAGAAAQGSQAATAGGPAAGTNIPGVGINKGGFISRFNAGVPFVPGSRGANVDSVPALLTVGEGVIQRPSVDFYGKRAIAAINARMVPRNALRALTGGGATARGMASGGFNRGGVASSAVTSGPGFAGGVLPIMPTDRVTTEQLAGGATKTALMRLMRDNPSGFKRALGIQDRQVR